MNASDILMYGHQTVLEALDGLPETEWDTAGVTGVWSVRNIIAHLASFEHFLIEVLGSFLDGDPTPYMDKMATSGPAAVNDDEVAARKDRSPGETLSEYQEAHAQTMELITRISPETLREVGTIPWYGSEYALDDLIVYMYYGHKREHCAQLDAFRDRLES